MGASPPDLAFASLRRGLAEAGFAGAGRSLALTCQFPIVNCELRLASAGSFLNCELRIVNGELLKCYSTRNALTGSILLARSAGRYAPSHAVSTISAAAAPQIRGSATDN